MRTWSWLLSVSLLILLGLVSTVQAQEAASTRPSEGPTKPDRKSQPGEVSEHRFWDRKNAALFVGVGGARALDYASSLSFRSKGIDERLLSNRLVDNRPLFATIEALGTAGSLGLAYLFHRTGHHKLERWVSIVHISIGVGGSVRNYILQPDPPPAVRQ